MAESSKGMPASQTSRLFKIVASPALLYVFLSSLLALTIPFSAGAAFLRGILPTAVIAVPDALATWWLFRRLRAQVASNDARRGATAFAFSTPVVLGVGYVLGELVGGYAELFLGNVFILPVVIVFIAVLMVTIPAVVVLWALHPSGGVGSVNQESQ